MKRCANCSKKDNRLRARETILCDDGEIVERPPSSALFALLIILAQTLYSEVNNRTESVIF
jgi:hypothetical protein